MFVYVVSIIRKDNQDLLGHINDTFLVSKYNTLTNQSYFQQPNTLLINSNFSAREKSRLVYLISKFTLLKFR